jgi:hypothetical protein
MTITRQYLKGYLDRLKQRGVGKKIAGQYFAMLHTFYDCLVYEGLMAANP